ncbi:MAG: hypothetical protein NTX71_10010 [Candidatus Aureabacteria bacterium]|nr:hypothetical protein [Candidatus Auribacterota bacterium]
MLHADKIRMVVFPTIFGVLWGLLETLLGSYLHMFNTPFAGTTMAGIGAIIMCVERLYTPLPGATISTAAVAVAMKVLSVGTVRLAPAIGISVEAVLAELLLTVLGTGWCAFLASCVACTMEGIPHFFIAHWIMYGQGIFNAYLKVIEKLQASFGLGENLWKQILVLWVAGHLVIGIACGLLAISVGNYVRRK